MNYLHDIPDANEREFTLNTNVVYMLQLTVQEVLFSCILTVKKLSLSHPTIKTLVLQV